MREQIDQAKARQKEEARRRARNNVRRTSSASTDNSQATERPPQAYQAPQINVPDDLHDVAKLIHGEFTKIAQSQSVLMSLWKKMSHMTTDGTGVFFGDAHAAGVELGWNDTGTISYLDFHAGGDNDYDVRLRVDATGSTDTGDCQLAVYASEAYLHMPASRSSQIRHFIPNRDYAVGTAATYQYPIGFGDLGTSDLDNIDYRYIGIHEQNATANATTARHYPAALAGWLEVIGGGINQGACLQRYTAYNDSRFIYVRNKNAPTAAWSAWSKFSAEGVSVEEAVTRAKLEIYADLAKIGIVVPVVIPGG